METLTEYKTLWVANGRVDIPEGQWHRIKYTDEGLYDMSSMSDLIEEFRVCTTYGGRPIRNSSIKRDI